MNKATSTLLVLCCLVACASATTYYVSPFGDDSNPGTESKPFKSLKFANDKAATGDTIILMDGLYSEPAINIHLTIKKAITIRGQHGPENTVFWCERNQNRDGIVIDGTGITVAGIKFLQCGRGVFFHGGSATLNNIIVDRCINYGVYADNYQNSVAITNSVFTSNPYGVFWTQTSSSTKTQLTVEHCEFRTNGLAIRWSTALSRDSNATVSWTNVTGAGSIKTAGFDFLNVDYVTVLRSNFKNMYDVSASGSGINVITSKETFVQFCTFNNMVAKQSSVYLSPSTSARIDNCEFATGVSQNNNGGAIYTSSSTVVTVANTNIHHYNGAANGGAIFGYKLTMQNVQLSYNTAKSQGGGVYQDGAGQWSNVELNHNTALNNGGGAFFGSSAVVNAQRATFMNNNSTGSGGGFACIDAGINLFTSNVHDNIASNAGTAGFYCTRCELFLSGTTVKDTTDCPGA